MGDIPLQRLLARVLDLALQGSLDEQRDAEATLARLLLSGAPRSDRLIEECVRRLGWEQQERALSPDALLLAVLARRQELATLAALRSGQHPLAGAFVQLARPASPLTRWCRAQLPLTRRRPALQLLELLASQHPGLLRELEAGEVSWWRRFEAGPKLSASMLGMGIAFIPWLMLVHAARIVHSRSWWDVWQVLCWPVAGALVPLGRLYLLDWPAWLIARRPRPLPLMALAGWLPMLLGLFGASFALRGIAAGPAIVAVAGLAGCLWAVYVSGLAPSSLSGRPLVPGSSRLARVLLLTPVPALWCALALQDLTWPLRFTALEDASWVGALCLLSGCALGTPALQVLWTSRLSARQRLLCRAALCLAAPIAGLMLVLVAGPWLPVLVWLLVAFVAVHRIALLDRPAAQDRARWLLLLAALAPMLPAAMASEVRQTDVVFGLGLALVVSAFLNLCMAWKALKGGGGAGAHPQ